MSATASPKFAPTEVRASEVARGCDRLSVYRATGAEQADHDDEQHEWFRRGHLFEQYYGKQLDAKHGRENIVRQPSFEHPLGVGHSDFLVVPDRLLVEVKSTTSGTLSTPVFDNGVTQVRIAVHFHPDADRGALVMLNPSTLKPAEVFEVVNTPEDDDRIDEVFARIEAHIQLGTLPDRVCTRPSQARGYFCPFAKTCFEGWTEPEPLVIDAPEALDAASRLYAITQEEHIHKAAIKALEDEKRAATAALRYFAPERGESVCGPFHVKTWPVDGRTTLNVKALQAAGIDTERFATKGDSRISVRVSKADTPGPTDFGDEAPF